jgi:hypothetical protein
MNKYFKTKKRLEIALDNAHRIEGFEEYLYSYYLNIHDLDLDEYGFSTDLPYWIYDNPDYKDGEYACELVSGYINRIQAGDPTTIGGERYECIDSIPLSEEIELQSDCGGLCYYNIGYHFIRIYRKAPTREVLISDHWGIHIPKRFLELADSLGVKICEHDRTVLSDPEDPEYWEVWDEILRDTEIEIGIYTYRLEQDGDLFLVCD